MLLENFSDDAKFEYKWEVMREMMPRGKKGDPITKFKFIYANGYMFGVTLRESGDCDLYWNFMHIAEVEGKNIQDIAMSFGSFFFKSRNGQIF